MIGPPTDTLFSEWNSWLKEVLGSKALTLFEPETCSLPNVRIGQARFICNKLAKASDDSFLTLPQAYGRHTTLAGIWMFLAKDHRTEFLVTAFGKRMGSGATRPAQFNALHVSHGAANRVRFSNTCIEHLQRNIEQVNNAEVLICHNHPRNAVTGLLSQLVEWTPLPSDTDRETMHSFKYRAVVRWLASGNFPSLRIFLVENGGLREIVLPSMNRIAKWLKLLSARQNV